MRWPASADHKAAFDAARGAASGIEFARELGNLPPNLATPTRLGEEARKLAKAHGFQCEVMGPKEVAKLGMGALMAVARGSEEPLRFIVLKYQGAAASEAPVVLVGKGITFDSGGISIKPAPEMDEMKFDMGGGGERAGHLPRAGELRPALNVVGLIPGCENLPDGRALKPGDVLTSLSGQTIEVLNTDAEGRLILCDALTYAERFKPRAVVDIATLTGACVIALGAVRSGLFASDDDLARALHEAGEAALRSVLADAAGRRVRRGPEDELRRRRQRGRARRPAPSPPPSSCSASPTSTPGRTWTSPAPPGRAAPPRAPPAARSACWCST